LITSVKNNKCSPHHCRPLLQKFLGKGSPFNVSYQNCCRKNIYVNDSQNLAFATSHFVIELFPLIIWVTKSSESTKKMHFKRNNSSHTCRTFSTWEMFCRSWHAEHFCSLNFPSISYSFWDIRRKVLKFYKFDEKRAITPRWVIRFTSKLQGR
jgi:hypothetical protein